MARDMTTTDNPMTFTLGACSRVLGDWRRERRDSGESVWNAIRRYARAHGAAGVWMADDSYRLFWRNGATVRQRTWRHARPIRA